MINNDYLAAVAACHQVDRLHAEADAVRLLKLQRSARPRLTLRQRFAGFLRRVADRLAPGGITESESEPKGAPLGRHAAGA